MPSLHPIDSDGSDGSLSRRVSPFGDLRIEAYLRLPAAFRSWSRPSSANGALASTLCSSLLDFLLLRPFFLLSPVTASGLTSDFRLSTFIFRFDLCFLTFDWSSRKTHFSSVCSCQGSGRFISSAPSGKTLKTIQRVSFSNGSPCSSHFPLQSFLTDRP